MTRPAHFAAVAFAWSCATEPPREAETRRACACDEMYASPDYYYELFDERRTTRCATDDEAELFVAELADECVADLEGQGFELVTCDCWCDDTRKDC